MNTKERLNQAITLAEMAHEVILNLERFVVRVHEDSSDMLDKVDSFSSYYNNTLQRWDDEDEEEEDKEKGD